jgi:predicted nucleotidyltransferase
MLSTERIGARLRRLRQEHKLPLRKVAALLDIDVAILSKMERGERRLTREIVEKLAALYQHDLEELLVLFLSEKVLYEIGHEALALKALQVAEESVTYKVGGELLVSDIVNCIQTILSIDGRVSDAWIFGSFAKGEPTSDSDVDIMISFNNKKKYSLFDLADITYLIEKEINRKVDLVEKGNLHDFAWKTAQNDLIRIYG